MSPFRPARSVAAAVAAFLLAGAVAVAVIAAATALLWRHQAEKEAIADARTLTMVEARDVVGPALSDQALVRDSAAWHELERIVRDHVLDADVVRMKIWAADGTIVYSDDAALIGSRFDISDDIRKALNTTETYAEVSDLQAPENRDERQFGKLLEVYLAVHTSSGQPLMFETYQRYDAIAASSRQIWRNSIPALVGGLLLLYVVQAPLAYRLATRLRRAQAEREQALLDSLAASDAERRRIAADLHDGLVQGLAGVSYTLSAAGDRAEARADNATAEAVRGAARDLRGWVRELRSLVVTIAPPKLHQEGLAAALHDLPGALSGRGIEVRTDVKPLPGLDPEVETLAFRAAQEAVRNVVKHAGASMVTVGAEVSGDVLTVEVTDNGRGLASEHTQPRRAEGGGQGLALLADLARAHGGELTVGVPPTGTGTTVRLTVPTQRRDA